MVWRMYASRRASRGGGGGNVSRTAAIASTNGAEHVGVVGALLDQAFPPALGIAFAGGFGQRAGSGSPCSSSAFARLGSAS